MTRQAEKYQPSLAGEYYAAAELQRRGVPRIDQGSTHRSHMEMRNRSMWWYSVDRVLAVVEVKSTGQPQWVVGGKTPEPSGKPWIFVRLPADFSQPPGSAPMQHCAAADGPFHKMPAVADARKRAPRGGRLQDPSPSTFGSRPNYAKA